MPHIPDSTHDTHDLELVAAFAAGDAAGTALDDARALVATCADCAALHRDLRAIATAMPTLPVPARPRDFRLTPAQAAALRPRGWRGLVAAFGSPRFSFAAPLGSGLAALGLVGILVSSGGLPAGGGAIPAVDRELGAAASVDPVPDKMPAQSMLPDARPSVAPSQGIEIMGGSARPDDPVSVVVGDPSPAPRVDGTDAGAATALESGPETPLLPAATLAVLAGLALVTLRLAARRVA